MNKKKESIEMKCKRCKHKWEYTGKEKIKKAKKWPQYVTCPNCHTSVKIKVD